MGKRLHSVHPGEVLLEEFLKPMDLSQNRLAINIGVPSRRINEIALGKRSITADTALRLARFFGNSAEFWLGLQAQYDLDVTAEALGERLEREVKKHVPIRPSDPFTRDAKKRWNKVPKWAQAELLKNVYCGKCHDMVAISLETAKMQRADLILRGKCKICGHDVCRVVEPEGG
ncbi:MAG: HigA family addiction module antitoxin [Candidatus Aquicultor sp.]|nr:HigA family addiction module antitoxin [Candidatus Aquicultor sp.]